MHNSKMLVKHTIQKGEGRTSHFGCTFTWLNAGIGS